MEKHDPMNDPPPPYPGTAASTAPPYYMPPAFANVPKRTPQLAQEQRHQVVVGPAPANIICPSCQAVITTRIEPKVTSRTHIMAGILCILFGIFCFWLPYCLDDCKNADHYCPHCEAYIGTYTR